MGQRHLAAFDQGLIKTTAITLVICVVAGWVATLLRLPLPWMLGPLITTMVLSLAKMKLHIPNPMKVTSRYLVGTILGATVTLETLSRVAEWPISLAILLTGTVLITLLCSFYLFFVARFDRITALSASLPGALSTIPAVSIELGADPKRVVMPHLIRITLIVMLVPPLYAWWQGASLVSPSGAAGGYDLMGTHLWVIALALPGWWLAKLLRFPIPELTGPMMATAACSLLGYQLVLPDWLFALTFLLLGSAIGIRFYGMQIWHFINTGKHAVVTTVINIIVTLGSTLLILQFTDLEFHVVLLAVMPGGIAEMTILAAVLGVDPVFVAFHQIVRSLLLNLGAPFIIQRFGRDTKPAP